MLKTEAHCPTCNFPFSFWRVVFLLTPFQFYCKNCSRRIVIGHDKAFMGAAITVVALISIILFQFIIARDMRRLLILVVLWIVSFYIVEIITALVIVNVAQFYKPEEGDGDNRDQ